MATREDWQTRQALAELRIAKLRIAELKKQIESLERELKEWRDSVGLRFFT